MPLLLTFILPLNLQIPSHFIIVLNKCCLHLYNLNINSNSKNETKGGDLASTTTASCRKSYKRSNFQCRKSCHI